MIYSIVNTKGGVGKTTVALHLATLLAREHRTLLIDGDPQASAASWAAWRREAQRTPSPITTCLVGKAILTEGKSLAEGFTHVVVDAGGRDSVGLRSSLLLAGRAIVPIGASSLDAAALSDLLGIVDEARSINPNLQRTALLTRIDVRTKDTDDLLKYLSKQRMPVMESRICERVAYRRAVGEGAIVHEIGRDNSAIAEVESFYREAIG